MRFSTELVKVIPINEEGAEGIHRDVSLEVSRAHGVRLWSLGAMCRFRDNLELCQHYISRGKEQQATFNEMWASINIRECSEECTLCSMSEVCNAVLWSRSAAER